MGSLFIRLSEEVRTESGGAFCRIYGDFVGAVLGVGRMRIGDDCGLRLGCIGAFLSLFGTVFALIYSQYSI